MAIEEIRKQFPRANYAPRENCKWCNGTGIKSNKPGMPCICIFVDHSQCDWAAKALAKVAKQVAQELSCE